MKQPYIVGWGHTPFGKLDNMDFDQGGELSRQEIFVGLMNMGAE